MNKLSSIEPKEQITTSSPPHSLKKKGYKIRQKITSVLTAHGNEVFSVDICAQYRIVGSRYSCVVTESGASIFVTVERCGESILAHGNVELGVDICAR